VALLRPKKEAFVSRPVLLGGAAIFAAALVLSYSRASLLNVVISVTALLWLRRWRFRWRQTVWLAIPAAALYYLFPLFAVHYWDRLSASAPFQLAGAGGFSSAEPGLCAVGRRL
jgi:hypothetical protein